MTAELKQTVFFIGFMGAGKTTVSRKLAKMCACECVDVDYYIERSVGKKISEIFAESGEAAFRKMETEALQKICESSTPRFVSCGGGIIVIPENKAIMQNSGVVVHLLSDAHNSVKRISNLKTRPLFEDVNRAQARFEERLPLYEDFANYTIDTTGKFPKRVSNDVYKLLVKKNIIEES